MPAAPALRVLSALRAWRRWRLVSEPQSPGPRRAGRPPHLCAGRPYRAGGRPYRGTQSPQCRRGQCGVARVGPFRGHIGIAPGINRLTGRQQREMAVPWRAVIGEGVEARVARQVAGLQGDGAPGRVANQVVAEGGDRPETITANDKAPAVLRARMVFCKVTVRTAMPHRLRRALLSARVLLVSVSSPELEDAAASRHVPFGRRYCW